MLMRCYAFYRCRKHYIQKCQQLEKENDKQRDQLNELIKKEKTMALALQKYTKEHQNLLKQLEVAEIEVKLHLLFYADLFITSVRMDQ